MRMAHFASLGLPRIHIKKIHVTDDLEHQVLLGIPGLLLYRAIFALDSPIWNTRTRWLRREIGYMH